MHLRDLREEDLGYCRLNDVSRGKFTEPGERVDWAFTLVDESKILGCGGFQKITDCCAWAWMSLTPDGKADIKMVIRSIRQNMEDIRIENGITRVQAWSEVGFEESARFLEHLGFNKEGFPLIGFIDKDTPAQMWVRFFKDTE